MTNYYTEGQLVKFHEEKFFFLEIQETKDVLEIKLNRIAKKNNSSSNVERIGVCTSVHSKQ